MSSTVMVERTGMGIPGMGVSGVGSPSYGAPTAAPTSGNYVMVPRCTLKFEKCSGGMKVVCVCEDKMACSMVQNLCTMLAGGMCSCCVLLNGMTICTCNFTMGLCKCEMTDSGVSITCTSGDSKCCEMIQAYCDCLSCLIHSGCTCCVLMNNTPICCGVSDTPVKTTGTRK
jgi:hypothetical protein